MAEDLTPLDELREMVEARSAGISEPWRFLQQLARHLALSEDRAARSTVRDVIIQVRERRDAFPDQTQPIVDALVREIGLFPYLDRDDTLSQRDLLIRETLREPALSGGAVIFHAAQAEVYSRLLEGRNVILSAPTSFGKSLLIDAALVSGKFDNVLIVVPTLALIDETRRRVAGRETRHKVITHPSQPAGKRNVFILTAERVLEFEQLPALDLFVLDEFYKLGDDDERAQVLNQVFYEIRRQGVQHYLLGPNVEGLAPGVDDESKAAFLRSDASTVALRFHQVPKPDGEDAALAGLCAELDGPTLVYCQSPDSAHRAARMLLKSGLGAPAPDLMSAAAWVGTHYHPHWVVTQALSRGIGIHHGRLPRALGQFLVNAFEDGRIKLLLCTGTLIEGVNTQAQNVVIFDRYRPGNRKMDAFTFRNISGRSGRMFRHFSGDVYLMHDVPADDLPAVDIPIISQGEQVPTSLLQHVDLDDLSPRSKERLEPIRAQDDLSLETLKANVGLPVEGQIALARTIRGDLLRYHDLLAFKDTPTQIQLRAVCDLLWEHFGKRALSGDYVRSPRQLARQLLNFSLNRTTRALVAEAAIGKRDDELDKAIAGVCGFVRNVASFSFPVRLKALERIQREVFSAAGMLPGDYSSYIAQVEGLFLPSPLLALDEYGVPPELSSRLQSQLRPDGDLDAVLERLKLLVPDDLPHVTEFEREMLRFAQSGIYSVGEGLE